MFPSLVEFLGKELHYDEVFEPEPSYHTPSEESNESHDS